MNYHDLLLQPLRQLLADYPWLVDFFSSFGLQLQDTEQTLQQYLDGLDPDQLLDLGISQDFLPSTLPSCMCSRGAQVRGVRLLIAPHVRQRLRRLSRTLVHLAWATLG